MPYFGIPIRNGLPIGLGSVAGFGVQQFSPADLFSAGEQGAWYDPSDLSTLFTDSAGTTPVTAVEQFVGLMLDKSKGLVLGSEIAPSTNYSSGWTTQPGVTLPGTTAVYTSVANNNGAYFGGGANIVAGRFYEVTYTISSLTAGGLAIYIGGTPSTVTRTVAGTYTERLGTVATDGFVTLRAVGTTTAVILSFSIKQVTGNHATQTTSAKRPKLAARYNLLTYTEQFDNAAWTKTNVTVTANSTTAPDGTLTADTLTAISGAYPNVNISITLPSPTTVKHSVYFQKTTGATRFPLSEIGFSGGNAVVILNTDTGVATLAQGAATNITVTDVNGYWRLSFDVAVSVTSVTAYIYPASSSNGTTFAPNLTGSCVAWGADLRPASQATGLIGPTYQRVVDAATYDAVGFLPYLQFDGLSWSMGTNSIDFSAGDKVTAWAGVRKLSGSAGVIAELSADTQSNNGSFVLGSAFVSATTYDVQVRGTDRNARSYSTYTAPVTNVLQTSITTSAADSASAMQTRVNSATNAGSSFLSVASTGNYGNYPLFIGARNNASLFFQGWLTSLIVRGAQSTQSQIEATEAWVNQRTGAF
jgi:hypothetical protein